LSATPAGAPVGLFQFAIEGRRAPALFLTGWLSTLVGIGATVVGLLAAQGGGSSVLFGAGLAIVSIGLVLLGGSQTIERAAAGRAYAGPSPVLVLGTAISTTLVATLVIGTPLELSGIHVERPVGDLIFELVQALVFIGVVRLMVVGPGAISWADMGFGLPLRGIVRALAFGAVFAVPLLFITGIVGATLIAIFGVAPAPPLPASGTSTGLVLNLVTASVLAPIAEETLFRGVAVTAWARTTGPRTAIVRAAVLFALAHVLLVGGDSFGQAASLAIVSAAGRLPVALGLGWVYLRSGTIWAPIGLHAAFNALIVIALEAHLFQG
jgi:membrane protease YdiL (CAAX protease family)